MKKKYRKTIAAIITAAVVLNNGLVFAAENTIQKTSQKTSVENIDSYGETDVVRPLAVGNTYYIDPLFSGTMEDGSIQNPYTRFSTAYAQAKDGDTIVLKGVVSINGQGALGDEPFVCSKAITIEGLTGSNPILSSRSSFQLGANVTLKNCQWMFPNVEPFCSDIYLNGYKLDMQNVSINKQNTLKLPNVYGGAYKQMTGIQGTHSQLIINNQAGYYATFENIYAGDDDSDFIGDTSLQLNSGVTVNDTIYANGLNGGAVTGHVSIVTGRIIAPKFVKQSSVGTDTLVINDAQRTIETTFDGLTNITLNSSSVKIKSLFNGIKGNLQLLGNSKLDVSNLTTPLQIGGSFTGEAGSMLVLPQNGAMHVTQTLNGEFELRTPGVAFDTSGLVTKDHVYITASNDSTGQVNHIPYLTQSMYTLKMEEVNAKKQWVIRVTDSPKLEILEIEGQNRLPIIADTEHVFTLSYKDAQGNPLTYTPDFICKVMGPDGIEIPEEGDIWAEVSRDEMSIVLFGDQLQPGQYTVVLTDTLTNKEFTYNLTLYNAAANMFTVTYEFNGGHAVNQPNVDQVQVEVEENTLLTKIADPIREGYTFNGWYQDRNFTTEWDFANSLVTANTTLYAHWTANSYRVHFHANDGMQTAVTEQNFLYDTAMDLNINPFMRTGYTFTGWATEANGTKVYEDQQNVNNLTTVQNDIVDLYAVWTPISYKVQFIGGTGAAGTMTEQIFTYDIPANLSMNTFTKPGYTFTGWQDANGNLYTNQAEVLNLADQQNEVVILTAQWSANAYTVVFDGNGATSGTMQPQTFAVDQTQALFNNAFTKNGYTFSGWIDQATNQAYTNAQAVQNLTTTAGDVVTLSAKWTANTYYLDFNTDGGIPTIIQSAELTYDTSMAMPAAPTKSGYTFAGWRIEKEDGTVEIVDAGAAVQNLAVSENARVTATALWTANTYTLTFDINGGDIDSKPSDMLLTHNQTQNLPAIFPTKLGYTFMGWSIEKTDGTTEMKQPGDSVINLANQDGVLVTATAQWTANTYTIHFDANGGIGNMNDQSFTYDVQTPLQQNQFTKSGYIFAGWQDQSGNRYTDAQAVINATAENGAVLILSAQWILNGFIIQFDGNGATNGNVSSQEFLFGSNQTLTANTFTKTGYTFVGWLDSATGMSYMDQQVVQDLTLTVGGMIQFVAQWKANSYTVVFDSNGGSGSMVSQQLIYDDPLTALTNNTFIREGYEFAGWALSANGDVVYTDGQMIQNLADIGQVTLYAQWIAKQIQAPIIPIEQDLMQYTDNRFINTNYVSPKTRDSKNILLWGALSSLSLGLLLKIKPRFNKKKD